MKIESTETKEPLLGETVVVEMAGPSGNAYSIMGAVASALRRNGRGDLVADYHRRATSGDYENLLKASEEFVTIMRV